MIVKYDRKNNWYIIKEKIDNQTFFMSFERFNETDDTVYFNIAMGVYNKRKHSDENENLKKSTGKNPFLTIKTAIQAFNLLEETIQLEEIKRIYLCCSWTDNRRRDAYYKFLSKRGFQYGNFEGRKVIYKIYER